MSAPLVFIDVETTGLGPDAKLWEIAAVTDSGETFHTAWTPDLAGAELGALAMNRLVERWSAGELNHPVSDPAVHVEYLHRWAPQGCVLAGASVHFDLAALSRVATRTTAPWSYRLLDVTTYAAAVCDLPGPMSLKAAAEMVGLTYDEDMAHGAFYDAWLAREVYAAVGCLPDSWSETSPHLPPQGAGTP